MSHHNEKGEQDLPSKQPSSSSMSLPKVSLNVPVDEPMTHLAGNNDEEENEAKGQGRTNETGDEDTDAPDDQEENNDNEDNNQLKGEINHENEVDTEPLGKSAKGKGKAIIDQATAAAAKNDQDDAEKDKEQSWQAVWAPEQNAYYFWNTETGDVTWINPLEPITDSATPPSPPPLPSGPPPIQQSSQSTDALPTSTPSLPSALPEIDPALAFLLPPEQRGASGDVQAMFNSRTGKFTTSDYSYTIGHLDEYNRMKRMNEHYFDQEAWEKERAMDHAKRKREEAMGVRSGQPVTKKDMDRFRKKAAEKKARRQAWLRD